MSQSALARAVGVRQSTINALLTGESKGSKHLHVIARALRTTPAYLTGEVDDPDLDAPEAPSLTAEEVAWLEILRALDARNREALLIVGRTMMIGPQPVLNAGKTAYRGEDE